MKKKTQPKQERGFNVHQDFLQIYKNALYGAGVTFKLAEVEGVSRLIKVIVDFEVSDPFEVAKAFYEIGKEVARENVKELAKEKALVLIENFMNDL